MQVVEGQYIPHIGYLFVAIFPRFLGELPRMSVDVGSEHPQKW
jgi:hypothetical protein